MGFFEDAVAGHMDHAKQIREYKKGKTLQEQKVIDYFTSGGGCGCLNKAMKDEEYKALVVAKRDSLKLRERALSKIGLDEDQVKEIPPVRFEGYLFEKAFAKQTANGRWISSCYQVAWLFFSNTQIYIYRYEFHMDEAKKAESTDEFFYKDVTSFSTSNQSEKAISTGGKAVEVETNRFIMVVPGDKMMVAIEGVENAEQTIQGMKQKLREKKS